MPYLHTPAVKTRHVDVIKMKIMLQDCFESFSLKMKRHRKTVVCTLSNEIAVQKGTESN